MRIPEEIRKKIELKLQLDKEIWQWLNERTDTEDLCFETIDIVDSPAGIRQKDGEFCDQNVGICGDDFYGHYYWQMDNGKYLCMYFQC